MPRGEPAGSRLAAVSDLLGEAVELFTTREEAEAIVQAWDRDEPDQVGELRVEKANAAEAPTRRRSSVSQPTPGSAPRKDDGGMLDELRRPSVTNSS